MGTDHRPTPRSLDVRNIGPRTPLHFVHRTGLKWTHLTATIDMTARQCNRNFKFLDHVINCFKSYAVSTSMVDLPWTTPPASTCISIST